MTLFAVNKSIDPQARKIVTLLSFACPILLWCVVSYVPFIWHPQVEITNPGGVSYFREGMLVDREVFAVETSTCEVSGCELPQGDPANPVYLPAPHEVVRAFVTAFTTEPQRRSEMWLHESLWSSIQVIFWGFVLSSIIGIPLGILAGTYDFFSKLIEPFI